MTDVPLRVYGPRALNNSLGEVLYTAPSGTSKFFIRDITLTNLDPATALRVKLSIGSISDTAKHVYNKTIPAADTTLIRPLWLMDAAETFEGLTVATTLPAPTVTLGVLDTGTDGTAFATAAWTPSATTMYLLVQANGVASGTTALNPSSITGNGTWTLINQTTSTVAAAVNTGVSAWWWYSSAAGANATTTVNFASTQHSADIAIYSMAGVLTPPSIVTPWTTTARADLNSAVAADTTAPASTSVMLPVTIGAVGTGQVMYLTSRAGGSNTQLTAPTGMAGQTARNIADAAGSLASNSLVLDATNPAPWTRGTTVGTGGTWNTSTTGARASIAWEMVPSSWVNCMVSGIEVK